MSVTAGRMSVTVAELVEAVSDQRRSPPAAPPRVAREPVPDVNLGLTAGAVVVVVVGAHPGAGASTVSVAVADALAQRDDSVRLVDGAPQDASGLICAAGHELGAAMAGWRTGRRGAVEVARANEPVSCPEDLPGFGAFGSGWLVVDAGWPLNELLAGHSPVAALLAVCRVVLVCRATVPGVRRMEQTLTVLAGLTAVVPLVVVVGARRLPGEVRASFGPLLRKLSDSKRLVLVPGDRRLEVHGIEPHPLPKPVAAAAMRLLDVLDSDVPPVTRADRPTSEGQGR